MKLLPPVLALLLNAFFWGVSWWPLRWFEGRGLHPLWTTAIVFVFSLLGLLAAARPWRWRGLAGHPALWLLGAAAGLTNAGFNWAVTEGDVVRVVLLFYLMPAWAVLLAWLLLGQRPTPGSLLRMLLALAGVALVLKAETSPWPVPESRADWLALLGGFCFALTNVMLRRLRHMPAQACALAMFGGGALIAGAAALLGMALGLVGLPPAPAPAWVGLAALLGAVFLASNLALQFGAARLNAHTTALVMLSEVLFASVSAVLLGAASLPGRIVLGGGLILLAALLSALASERG